MEKFSIGFQSRNVYCGSQETHNVLDEKYCEAVLKPKSSQTCRNRKCKGVWKVSDWSEVIVFTYFDHHNMFILLSDITL